MNIAHLQDHRFFYAASRPAFEAVDPEGSVLGREVGLGGLSQYKTCGIFHEMGNSAGWTNSIIMSAECKRRFRRIAKAGQKISGSDLITLLVKIGVAASIASFGVRSDAVKRMLLREERTLAQRARMALWFAAIFTPGVLFRVITHGSYAALDLSLEGSLLAGITGGYICGWFAGMMIAVPSILPISRRFIRSWPLCRFSPWPASWAACCATPLPRKRTSGDSRRFPMPMYAASSSTAANCAGRCSICSSASP